MGVFLGIVMFFVCHTLATIFGTCVYGFSKEDSEDEPQKFIKKKFMKNMIIVGIIYAVLLLLTFTLFSYYWQNIITGNGIGFVTGGIHFLASANQMVYDMRKNYVFQAYFAGEYKENNDDSSEQTISSNENTTNDSKTNLSNTTNDSKTNSYNKVDDEPKKMDDEPKKMDDEPYEIDDVEEIDDEKETTNDIDNIDKISKMYNSNMGLDSFSFIQYVACGFMPDWNYDQARYHELLKEKEQNKTLSIEDDCKLIFPLIFGNFGCKIDLDKAYDESLRFVDRIEKIKPDYNINGYKSAYLLWLGYFAQGQFLLGTVLAYKKEYLKASYHLMKGLQTESITLSNAYCAFMRGVFSHLNDIPCDKYNGSGCGFSPNDPMGSCGGHVLYPDNTKLIIADMQGLNGEVVMVKIGNNCIYGHLERQGSVYADKTGYMIDVYETYLIDNHYKLSKLILYCNNYYGTNDFNIKIANGFRVKLNSKIIETSLS